MAQVTFHPKWSGSNVGVSGLRFARDGNTVTTHSTHILNMYNTWTGDDADEIQFTFVYSHRVSKLIGNNWTVIAESDAEATVNNGFARVDPQKYKGHVEMFNKNPNWDYRRKFSFQGVAGTSYKLECYTRLTPQGNGFGNDVPLESKSEVPWTMPG